MVRVLLCCGVGLLLSGSVPAQSPSAGALATDIVVEQKPMAGSVAAGILRRPAARGEAAAHALVLLRPGQPPQAVEEFAPDATVVRWKLVDAGPDSATVAFMQDYGFERERIKYTLDTEKGTVLARLRHLPVRVEQLREHAGSLEFQGEAGDQRIVGSLRLPAEGMPVARVRVLPGELPEATETEEQERTGARSAANESFTVRLGGGQRVRLQVLEVDEQGRELPPGITVDGPEVRFFPLPRTPLPAPRRPGPIPGAATGKKARRLSEQVGPRQLLGSRLWFAKEFYSGEGMGGVGDVGYFDAATLSYTMLQPRTMAGWSASALVVTPEWVAVGRVREPEGAPVPGGLLLIGRETKQERTVPVPAVILALHWLAERLFLGTADGLYALNGDRLTRFQFDPQPGGTYRLVARP